MSASSDQILQMLLAQKLGGGGQQQMMPTAGGGNAGPQMVGQVSPMASAANIAQKLMLMRALQQKPPGTPQPTPQTPAAGVQLGWTGGNGLPDQ